MAAAEKPLYWLEREDGSLRPATALEAGAVIGTEAARVARTERGEAYVSTVLLCLDHDWTSEGRNDPNLAPMVYESMVFGGPGDGEQRRYRSREEALAGHAEMIALHLPPVE